MPSPAPQAVKTLPPAGLPQPQPQPAAVEAGLIDLLQAAMESTAAAAAGLTPELVSKFVGLPPRNAQWVSRMVNG